MELVDNKRNNILIQINEFYNSIYNQFEYKMNNQYKINRISSVLESLLSVLVVGILFVIITLTQFKDVFMGSPFTHHHWKLMWVFIIWIIGWITYLILSYYYKRINKAFEDNTLNPGNLLFIYLFLTLKELKSFLMNSHNVHLQKSIFYFKKYTERKFNSHLVHTNDGWKATSLIELMYDLNNITWVEFSETTKKTLLAFRTLNNKLDARVSQGKDIKIVLSILENLLCYEYLILGNIQYNELSNSTNDNSKNDALYFLIIMANDLLKLDELTTKDENSGNRTFKQSGQAILQKINNLFFNKSIVVSIMVWHLFFAFLLVFLPIFIGQKIDYKFDSSAIATFIVAVSASTFAVLFGFKRKSKEDSN